jgi:NAD(P)-dependent dehydrogenase (short-subunit alcohol dehydrogenase family)
MNVKGKVAIVTGASSGVGLATVFLKGIAAETFVHDWMKQMSDGG